MMTSYFGIEALREAIFHLINLRLCTVQLKIQNLFHANFRKTMVTAAHPTSSMTKSENDLLVSEVHRKTFFKSLCGSRHR